MARTLTAMTLAALDRWNSRHPWSHNQAYTPVVLAEGCRARRARRGRSTARQPSRALDVGCGTGLLARRLGRSFDEVVGLEPSAPTAAIARRTTADTPSVLVVEGSLDALGHEQFDLVSLVAVLHHLPLEPTLRHPRSDGRPPVDMSAPTASPTGTLEEIRDAAARFLPGARLRRGAFWRYVLVWRAVPV